jgi:hypothetical protein
LINWKKVAIDYDGLYVTKNMAVNYPKNKQWTSKYLFVTMFDVATLCLWNADKFKLLEIK